MRKRRYFSLLPLIMLAALLLAFGCAQKPKIYGWEYVKLGAPPPPYEVAEEKAAPAEEVAAEPVMEEKTTHVVKKGECLWWIAEYQEIYGNPFMWPVIYDSNSDQIKDPDLIYPGQVFTIPRDYTEDEARSARKRAGSPE